VEILGWTSDGIFMFSTMGNVGRCMGRMGADVDDEGRGVCEPGIEVRQGYKRKGGRRAGGVEMEGSRQ
jgi:hypothetical protein